MCSVPAFWIVAWGENHLNSPSRFALGVASYFCLSGENFVPKTANGNPIGHRQDEQTTSGSRNLKSFLNIVRHNTVAQSWTFRKNWRFPKSYNAWNRLRKRLQKKIGRAG